MNSIVLFYLFAFVVAFLASAVFTPAARDLAFRVRLLDHPGPRKVHAVPMPLLGGLAVYLAAVFAVAVFVTDEEWSQMFGLFVAATLVLVVGTLDDRGMLHHQIKLLLMMPLVLMLMRMLQLMLVLMLMRMLMLVLVLMLMLVLMLLVMLVLVLLMLLLMLLVMLMHC